MLDDGIAGRRVPVHRQPLSRRQSRADTNPCSEQQNSRDSGHDASDCITLEPGITISEVVALVGSAHPTEASAFAAIAAEL